MKYKNQLRVLEEQNRGLRKRLKAVSKASENNHHGLMYWKTKATVLENGVAAAFEEWAQQFKD